MYLYHLAKAYELLISAPTGFLVSFRQIYVHGGALLEELIENAG
jgi:hypothetical protein